MQFAHPYWLVAGMVTVLLLVVLLVRAELLRSRAMALLVGTRLRSGASMPSRLRRGLRVMVITAAVAMGFVALARPQKGMHWETLERNGIDLLLVVDTSKSMDADDVKPTRLERSKLAIRDLVQRFPGDRIGLVAFAGDAFVQSPMTLDHGALLESVDALDTSVIARGGTNIGRGIDVANTALANDPARQKVMVLLTDGEDLEGQGLAEAQAAASAGITIDTVGVGTAAGELVPARDASGRTVGVMRDENGKVVRSHLDESGLKAIAAATHGEYRPLGEDGGGLDRLYDESLAKLTHAAASSRTHRVYSELFELPLGLALFGIVFEALLGRRWRALRSTVKGRFGAGRTLAVSAAGLVLFASPLTAHASVDSAAKSYAAGRFDDAAAEFQQQSAKNPKDARLAFNAGDSAYRAGHYDVADAAFKSALAAADPKLQERVLYNDGDVLYRVGESLKPEAREETIARWKAAIEAYDGALALDSKDADARFNRDFVQRKLKALEDQKKPDPPKQDPKKDESKDGKSGASGAGTKGDSKGSGGKQDQSPSGGDKDQAKASSGKDRQGSGAGSKPPTSVGPAPGGSATPTPGAGSLPAQAGAARPGTTPAQGGSDSHQGDPSGESEGHVGRLSARDARALLGALRGDERRGVIHAAAGSASVDDQPRKDW